MISRICNILSTTILIVIILMAGFVIGGKALGYEPMGVLSGSMEPKYHVGSLVFINTNAAVDKVKPNDVITFKMDDGASVVTHRVIAVDQESREFQTKGDANDTPDSAPVSFDAFVGVATLSIPFAGTILMNMGTPKGFAAICVLAAVLITLFIIPVFLKPESKKNGGIENEKRY